jgi:hypothetical protein
MSKSRGHRWVNVIALALAVGLAALVPASAHETESIKHNWRHYRKLAKLTFYTKATSNNRFVNVGETVGDGAIDPLIARDSEVFGLVLASDGTGSGLDADALDGFEATDFIPSTADRRRTVEWYKETADTLALTATAERVVFAAPDSITITAIQIEPAAALTASDANYATITIARRDSSGSNKAIVALRTTQTSGAGGVGDWTAFSAVSLGSLSNTGLSDGQKLTIEVAKSGTGVSLPILAVQIEYTVD